MYNGNEYECAKSLTLGKSCGWNSAGLHNCSEEFGETCVCFGSATPYCVYVGSSEYTKKVQEYSPKQFQGPDQVALEKAYTSASACQYSSGFYDPDVPSILAPSFIKSKTGCSFSSNMVDSQLSDPTCNAIYAKALCCYVCSGIIDVYTSYYTSFYPDFPRDEQIFVGPYLGPKFTLTCGANPHITYDPDTCGTTNVLSYNEIINTYKCDGSQPSFGVVSFTITVETPLTATSTLQAAIQSYLESQGLEPTFASLVPSAEDPNTYIVSLYYVGESNNPGTLSAVSETLQSSEFENHLSNYVPGTTVSDVTVASAQSVLLSMITLIVIVAIGLLF
jgi:hypothetical protein